MNTAGKNPTAQLIGVLLLIAAALISSLGRDLGPLVRFALPGLLVLAAILTPFSLLMARQWEKAVVLRFGKLHAVRGPGLSVEIRDVAIPSQLQDAMSRQAQAERERAARVILGAAEEEVAQKFLEAANIYARNPAALQLRAMNIIYETTKERGATILIPSAMVDSMNPGGITGLASIAASARPAPAHG